MTCDECRQPMTESACPENQICEPCLDKWHADQQAYWYPLYRGEVLAGIHRPEGEK